MAEKFKACPFCGSKNISVLSSDDIVGYYYAYCHACYVSTGNYETKAEATEAWNRRATMAENRIADVAAIFGKKLNEEFRINVEDVCIYRAKFTVGGLAVDFEEGHGYLENPRFEHDLLIGKAVIIDE